MSKKPVQKYVANRDLGFVAAGDTFTAADADSSGVVLLALLRGGIVSPVKPKPKAKPKAKTESEGGS